LSIPPKAAVSIGLKILILLCPLPLGSAIFFFFLPKNRDLGRVVHLGRLSSPHLLNMYPLSPRGTLTPFFLASQFKLCSLNGDLHSHIPREPLFPFHPPRCIDWRFLNGFVGPPLRWIPPSPGETCRIFHGFLSRNLPACLLPATAPPPYYQAFCRLCNPHPVIQPLPLDGLRCRDTSPLFRLISHLE